MVFGSVATIPWGTTYPELQSRVGRSPLVLPAGFGSRAGSGQQTCGAVAALDQPEQAKPQTPLLSLSCLFESQPQG